LSIGLAVAVFALFIIKQQSSRYALVDLVETKTPDELISFVRKTTDLAEGTGGHLVLAHNMLPPPGKPAKLPSPLATTGQNNMSVGLMPHSRHKPSN
jgi:hypothetical protein